MKKTLITIGLVLAVVFVWTYNTSKSQPQTPVKGVVDSVNSYSRSGTLLMYNFFNGATTTSATSTNITGGGGYADLAGAKKATFFFSRGDTTGQGNSGSTVFKVQVTGDGTNWVDYNKMISNVTNTNAQTLTRVSSVTISAATSTTITTMDLLEDTYAGVRCIVVETTDGEHTCKALIEY